MKKEMTTNNLGGNAEYNVEVKGTKEIRTRYEDNAPCKECGHRGPPRLQKCVIAADINNPIKANVGEHIQVGKHIFKITEGTHLDSQHEKIAGFKRVG